MGLEMARWSILKLDLQFGKMLESQLRWNGNRGELQTRIFEKERERRAQKTRRTIYKHHYHRCPRSCQIFVRPVGCGVASVLIIARRRKR